MSINFLGIPQSTNAMKGTSSAISSGISQETAQKFGELIAQAKARLEDPLGDVQFDAPDVASESVDFGLGGAQLALDSTDDTFAGVDSMNARVFASIRDTISQKLATLNQGKSDSVTHGGSGLSPTAILELSQMGIKIAELYAASDSVSYKKTAEKTIAMIAAKLNVTMLSGNEAALAGLKAIQSQLPEDSRPRFVLDLLLEDHPSTNG